MESTHDNVIRGRFGIIVFTGVVNVVALCVFAQASWSDWRTGLALSLFDNAVFLAYLYFRRDGVLGRLMLFGLVVGLTALVADAWLVNVVRALDYSIGEGPKLWRSPIWMPLAWEVLAVQIGCIGIAVMEKWSSNGLLAVGLVGSLGIPFIEPLAAQANWWQFRDCKMFFHTPYFVVLGEFAIVVCIILGARVARRGLIARALNSGVMVGAGIFASYAVAYWLMESG